MILPYYFDANAKLAEQTRSLLQILDRLYFTLNLSTFRSFLSSYPLASDILLREGIPTT